MSRIRFAVALTLAGLLASTAPAQEKLFLGKDARHWIGRLNDTKPEARAQAAFALGKIGLDPGGQGSVGVRPLLTALRDSDPRVRQASAFALGEIESSLEGKGTFWEITKESLLQALRDTDPRVRRSAAYALGAHKQAAAPARPDLLKALSDRQPMVRQNAAWALGQFGSQAGRDAIDRLTALLDDRDEVVRREAAGAVGEVGRLPADDRGRRDPHPAIGKLLDVATDKSADASLREAAFGAVVSVISPADRAHADRLNALMKDSDRDTERSAALALANIGGDEAKPAIPFLGRALREDDPVYRVKITGALANIGRPAEVIAADLAKVLTDLQPAVRRNAALALCNIGRDYAVKENRSWPDAAPVVPALAKLLDPPDANEEVRRYAAEGLSYVGDAVEEAIPALLNAVRKDPSPGVRHMAMWDFRQVKDLRGKNLVGPLTEALDLPDRYFLARYDAARVLALGLRQQAPARAADVLVQMLRDERLFIYEGSGASVRGGSGEKVDPGVNVEVRRGRDARFLAAQALTYMGSAANRPNVLAALEDEKNWNFPKTNTLNPEMKQRCQEAARILRTSR